MTEIGRKMFATEDDTIDDTYSAQLGHKGSAIALAFISSLFVATVYYFFNSHSQNLLYLAGPLAVLGIIFNSAYHYAIKPDRKNAKWVERGTGLLYITAMLVIILGI